MIWSPWLTTGPPSSPPPEPCVAHSQTRADRLTIHNLYDIALTIEGDENAVGCVEFSDNSYAADDLHSFCTGAGVPYPPKVSTGLSSICIVSLALCRCLRLISVLCPTSIVFLAGDRVQSHSALRSIQSLRS